MEMFSIFIVLLTATYARQQYKWNIFLCFHIKRCQAKAPQCNDTRTLPTSGEECVYCAVRADSLNAIQGNLSP
jgi:hypothetical protein